MRSDEADATTISVLVHIMQAKRNVLCDDAASTDRLERYSLSSASKCSHDPCAYAYECHVGYRRPDKHRHAGLQPWLNLTSPQGTQLD